MTTTRLPPEVVEVLGADRAKILEERAGALHKLAQSSPSATSWVAHMQVQLQAATRPAAVAEFAAHLRKHDPDFSGPAIVATGPDGSMFGAASEHFQPSKRLDTNDRVEFMFFDHHARLGGWWLTHVWRAADLGEATQSTLSRWELLPAAACARALLEGVAAFVVEGEHLLREWSRFKERGVPSVAEVREFRDQYLEILGQAQFASRIGERKAKASGEKRNRTRTNIMTILEKFEDRLEDQSEHFWRTYEWLCDAVHPSWGFSTAYVADRWIHPAKITFSESLARRAHVAPTRHETFQPTLGWAVVDAFDIAVRQLLVTSPRVRWLIDDIGLTTGAAFKSKKREFVGSTRRPEPHADCPCGSGLWFKKCVHRWGIPADPTAPP